MKKKYVWIEKNILIPLWNFFITILIFYGILFALNIKNTGGLLYKGLYLISSNKCLIYKICLVVGFIECILKYRNNIKEYSKKFIKCFTLVIIIFQEITFYLTDKFYYLWILILVIIFNIILNICDNKDKNKGKNFIMDDCVCQSYKDLFPSRQEQLNNIINYIISYEMNTRFTLLLNGEWGSGKTSLIKCLEERYETICREKFKNRKNINIRIIFIQPMLFDKKELLIEYFCERLEELFIEAKILIGKNSSIERYFKFLLKCIDKKAKLDIYEILNLNKKENINFRKIKNDLQNDIKKYTEKFGRIVVVVDDFDRVEEKTIKEILMFIRELIDFDGINTILLMNYSKIVDENNGLNKIYLDKYIDIRFELSKVKNSEILNSFFKKALEFSEIENLSKLNEKIPKVLNLFISNIQILIDSIDKLRTYYLDEKNTDSKEIYSTKIISCINNSYINIRCMKKIVRESCLAYINLQKEALKKNIIVDDEDFRFIFKLIYIKNTFIYEYHYIISLESFSQYFENNKNSNIKRFLKEDSIMIFFDEICAKRISEMKKINRFSIADAVLKNDFNNINFINKKKNNKFLEYLDKNNLENTEINNFNFEYGIEKYEVSFENLIEFYRIIKLDYKEYFEKNIFIERIKKLNKLTLELSKKEENLDELLMIYEYYGIDDEWFYVNNEFINDIYTLLEKENLKSIVFSDRILKIRTSNFNIFFYGLNLLVYLEYSEKSFIDEPLSPLKEIKKKLMEKKYFNNKILENNKSDLDSFRDYITNIKNEYISKYEEIFSLEELEIVISNMNHCINIEEVLRKIEKIFNTPNFNNIELIKLNEIILNSNKFENFANISIYTLNLILTEENNFNIYYHLYLRFIKSIIEKLNIFYNEGYDIKEVVDLLNKVFNKFDKKEKYINTFYFYGYLYRKKEFKELKNNIKRY